VRALVAHVLHGLKTFPKERAQNNFGNWLPLGNCSCIALLTYIHVGILLDDCMDAGGRVTQEQLPRGLG